MDELYSRQRICYIKLEKAQLMCVGVAVLSSYPERDQLNAVMVMISIMNVMSIPDHLIRTFKDTEVLVNI